MMMVAPISLVTAIECAAGSRPATTMLGPIAPPVLSQGHRSSLQDRSPHNGSPSKRMSVLDYSSAAGFTRPTLHRRCQRYPHSAR